MESVLPIKGPKWDPCTGFLKRTIYLCIALFIIFTAVPIFLSVFTSGNLTWQSFSTNWSWRTLNLLTRSLLLAASSATLAIFLGFPIGVGFWDCNSIIFRLRALIVITLLLPPYMVAQGWMALAIAPPLGLSFLGVPSGILWTIFILGAAFSPLAAIIIGAARHFFPPSPIESATIHMPGAKLFRIIIFPMLKPFVLATWLIVAMLVFLEGGVPLTLQVPVYATEITSRFLAGETPGALMISMLPLPLFALFAGYLSLKSLAKSNFQKADRAVECYKSIISLESLSAATRMTVYSLWALFFLILAMPLSGIIRQAFSGSVSSMSLGSDGSAVLWTIGVALTSSVITTMIALPLGAYVAANKPGSLASLLFFPLAIPASIIGIAWATLGSKLTMFASFLPESLPIVLAHTARILPFTLVVTAYAWKSTRIKNALDALSMHPKHSGQKIRLELPLISLAFLTSSVLSIRELEISLLTIPPGGQTLPIRVFNLLHYGAGADVCRISLLLVILLAFAGIMITRKWEA